MCPKVQLENGDVFVIDSRLFRFEYPDVLIRTPIKNIAGTPVSLRKNVDGTPLKYPLLKSSPSKGIGTPSQLHVNNTASPFIQSTYSTPVPHKIQSTLTPMKLQDKIVEASKDSPQFSTPFRSITHDTNSPKSDTQNNEKSTNVLTKDTKSLGSESETGISEFQLHECTEYPKAQNAVEFPQVQDFIESSEVQFVVQSTKIQDDTVNFDEYSDVTFIEELDEKEKHESTIAANDVIKIEENFDQQALLGSIHVGLENNAIEHLSASETIFPSETLFNSPVGLSAKQTNMVVNEVGDFQIKEFISDITDNITAIVTPRRQSSRVQSSPLRTPKKTTIQEDATPYYLDGSPLKNTIVLMPPVVDKTRTPAKTPMSSDSTGITNFPNRSSTSPIAAQTPIKTLSPIKEVFESEHILAAAPFSERKTIADVAIIRQSPNANKKSVLTNLNLVELPADSSYVSSSIEADLKEESTEENLCLDETVLPEQELFVAPKMTRSGRFISRKSLPTNLNQQLFGFNEDVKSRKSVSHIATPKRTRQVRKSNMSSPMSKLAISEETIAILEEKTLNGNEEVVIDSILGEEHDFAKDSEAQNISIVSDLAIGISQDPLLSSCPSSPVVRRRGRQPKKAKDVIQETQGTQVYADQEAKVQNESFQELSRVCDIGLNQSRKTRRTIKKEVDQKPLALLTIEPRISARTKRSHEDIQTEPEQTDKKRSRKAILLERAKENKSEPEEQTIQARRITRGQARKESTIESCEEVKVTRNLRPSKRTAIL